METRMPNETPKTKKYSLMYMFGAWVTDIVVYAESDKEAIFDVEEYADKLSRWQGKVALFCGNRMVKAYN